MEDLILTTKRYRVGFFADPPNLIVTKTSNGKTLMSGILYDIWRILKTEHTLNAEEIIIDKNIEWNQNRTNLCKDVANGKYDFIIGNFSVLSERKSLVHFTRPVQLNKIEFGYIPQVSKIKMFFNIFYKNLLFPLIFLLIIGVILGYALFMIDKGRGKRRAIFSTIASLFGEMGYVAERSNLTFKGMFVAFIIMLVSYYFTIYLQAVTIGDIIETTNSQTITKENISNLKPVLVLKGWASSNILKGYGAKIEEFDQSSKDMGDVPFMDYYVQYYIKNQDKYCGYLKDFTDYISDREKYGITITDLNFGFDEIAFPINKNHNNILHIFNKTIVTLMKDLKIRDICKNYGIETKYLSRCIV